MRSLAREGLDLLLTRHPEAEVAYVIHQTYQDDHMKIAGMTGPWTCVDLIIDGERRQFAIWNSTGNVYRVTGPEGAYPGAVEDDPFLVVVPLEQGQRKTAIEFPAATAGDSRVIAWEIGDAAVDEPDDE